MNSVAPSPAPACPTSRKLRLFSVPLNPKSWRWPSAEATRPRPPEAIPCLGFCIPPSPSSPHRASRFPFAPSRLRCSSLRFGVTNSPLSAHHPPQGSVMADEPLPVSVSQETLPPSRRMVPQSHRKAKDSGPPTLLNPERIASFSPGLERVLPARRRLALTLGNRPRTPCNPIESGCTSVRCSRFQFGTLKRAQNLESLPRLFT